MKMKMIVTLDFEEFGLETTDNVANCLDMVRETALKRGVSEMNDFTVRYGDVRVDCQLEEP